MFRRTKVKPHFRKGRPVVGHDRTVADSDLVDEENVDVYGLASSVADLADDTPGGGVNGKVDAVVRDIRYGTRTGDASDMSFIPMPTLFEKEFPDGIPERFENCDFHNVVFGDVDLRGREFVGCGFVNSSLRGVDLSGATFRECWFRGSNFSGVDPDSEDALYDVHPLWDRVKFEGCQFIQAQFNNVGLNGGEISGCSFDATRFSEQSRFYGVTVKDSRFNKSIFNAVSLSASVFEKCEFEGMTFERLKDDLTRRAVMDQSAEFRGCKFNNFVIGYSDLHKVKFDGSNVVNGKFSYSNLSEADFSNSTGNKLSFIASDLTGAAFSGCRLSDIEFSDSEKASIYDQHSLRDAMEASGLSEKQFEFLVVSGVIEVRDNKTLQKITSGFDVDKHHVPPWVATNLKRILEQQ